MKKMTATTKDAIEGGHGCNAMDETVMHVYMKGSTLLILTAHDDTEDRQAYTHARCALDLYNHFESTFIETLHRLDPGSRLRVCIERTAGGESSAIRMLALKTGDDRVHAGVVPSSGPRAWRLEEFL
jgi:hypothetical protein